jgi:hypothetical protein
LTVAPLYVAFNAIGDRLFSGLLSPLVDLTGWEREVVLEGLYLGRVPCVSRFPQRSWATRSLTWRNGPWGSAAPPAALPDPGD